MDVGKIILWDEIVQNKNKETDTKCFIEYKTGKKIRPLLITLPQMNGYFNKAGKTEHMQLAINGKKLLEMNQFGIGSATSPTKYFDRQPVYGGSNGTLD